jgi:hypothetical protein
MAIWAEKAQVLFTIIVPIAIYVVDCNRNLTRNRITLCPTALRATLAIFRNQIPSNVARDVPYGLQAGLFPRLPPLDISLPLIVGLAPIVAIYHACTFHLLTTGEAIRPGQSRHWQIGTKKRNLGITG